MVRSRSLTTLLTLGDYVYTLFIALFRIPLFVGYLRCLATVLLPVFTHLFPLYGVVIVKIPTLISLVRCSPLFTGAIRSFAFDLPLDPVALTVVAFTIRVTFVVVI